MTLAQIPVGQTVEVSHIYCDDVFFKRITAMGLRIGARVTVIRHAPLHGPVHVRVGTTDLALRRNLAENIKVL